LRKCIIDKNEKIKNVKFDHGTAIENKSK
jgi:hypothetical protein